MEVKKTVMNRVKSHMPKDAIITGAENYTDQFNEKRVRVFYTHDGKNLSATVPDQKPGPRPDYYANPVGYLG